MHNAPLQNWTSRLILISKFSFCTGFNTTKHRHKVNLSKLYVSKWSCLTSIWPNRPGFGEAYKHNYAYLWIRIWECQTLRTEPQITYTVAVFYEEFNIFVLKANFFGQLPPCRSKPKNFNEPQTLKWKYMLLRHDRARIFIRTCHIVPYSLKEHLS